MNSWTDIFLIVAIVAGLISAASLPLVSVNAISADALQLREARREAPPWSMLKDDAARRRVAAWHEATLLQRPRMKAPSSTSMPMRGSSPAGRSALGVVEALPTAILDPAAAKPASHH